MTPQVAALRIGRSITSFETDIDQLLANASRLLIELAGARVGTGVEAHTMQRPMARVVKAAATRDKGAVVAITGRLHYSSWTDRDGNTRYGCEIIADKIDFF